MSNVAIIPRGTSVQPVQAFDFAPRELSLIRRTVAADCNNDEFDLFISYAKALRLDPRRRQIYAFVYNKNKPDKRKMSIIVGIDGFRTIADRTGCYRPDEDEPRFEVDPDLKGPNNPAGLVKATVSAFKFSHDGWHRVTASAHWDEYAPLKDEWRDNPETGRGEKTGKQTLDTTGNWGRMPRLMLAKVAEALALRKAWPDDFANVYSAEEMDRAAVLDLSPSEAVEADEVQSRLERIGGANGILFSWDDANAPLESVPLGKIADRCLEFIRRNEGEGSALQLWRDRNRVGLQEFWARAKGDALAMKTALEAAIAKSATE